MWDSTGEPMMQDFDVIEVESRAGDALDLLRRNPQRPLIALDPGGRPACLLLLRENEAVLEAGGTRTVRELLGRLPPVVIEPEGFTLGELVARPEFSAFDLGASGVIAIRDGRPVGVVPVYQIARYLAEGTTRSFGHMRGAQSLGVPVSDFELPSTKPSTLPIVIHCRQFGHRNELQYIDRRSSMECTVKDPYPHPLR